VVAALRAADIALLRASAPAPLRRVLAACLVAAVAGLGLVASATGGDASPYFTLVAFVPAAPSTGRRRRCSTGGCGSASGRRARPPPRRQRAAAAMGPGEAALLASPA
jgi:hypothetical protein